MTEKDKKRKYLLFRKDDGRPDHLKPCAFFNSPEGCKNGSNCKFMHGSTPAAQATDSVNELSDATSIASLPDPPLPNTNSIKIGDKKRRTNDAGDDAPYPVFRIPSAEEEIHKLKEQMAHQQKLFEDQLKQLSNKITPGPPGITSLESRSMDPMIYTQLNSIQLIPSNDTIISKQSGHKSKGHHHAKPAISATESSDDEKFLFGTVNRVLENGRTDNPFGAPKAHKHKHEEKNVPQNLSNNHQNKLPISAFDPNKTLSAQSTSFLQHQTNNPFVLNANPTNSSQMQTQSTNVSSTFTSIPMTGHLFHSSAERRGPPPSPTHSSNNNSSERRFAPSPSPPSHNSSSYSLPTTKGIGMIGIADVGKKSNLSIDTNVFNANGLKSPESAKRKNIFAKPKAPTTPGGTAPKIDFKTIDYRHLQWEELIVKTQTHPRYRTDYSLNIDHSWVSARSSLKSEYPVIALDCEMCETEDPVTQVRESSLIRLSVVNGFNPDEVLIDTLVSPQLPISDLRTRIHGVTEEQLANVKYTLRHVQAALLNIITENTVIIGHSVYNDLKALHLNHSKCIDTAYLFPVDNESENSRPSLKLVAEQLLGLNIPEPHDSITDSRVALYAAAYALEVGCLPIKRTAASFEQPSLLVHRIPEYVTEEHVKSMIISHSFIVPASLSALIRGEATSANDPVGKVTVYFVSQAHADLAFETIQGPIKPDKKSRPQKKIYLQGGGHVYVRK